MISMYEDGMRILASEQRLDSSVEFVHVYDYNFTKDSTLEDFLRSRPEVRRVKQLLQEADDAILNLAQAWRIIDPEIRKEMPKLSAEIDGLIP